MPVPARFVLNPKLFAAGAEVIASDPAVALALQQNEPLPDRDLELEILRVTAALDGVIPAPFTLDVSGDAKQVLSSYLVHPLAKDLFPKSGIDHRITLLQTRVKGHAAGSAEKAFLPAGAGRLSADVNASIEISVLAAVDRKSGAQDQIKPVFEYLTVPALIEKPSDLAANVAILATFTGALQLSANVKLGYAFNWLRQVAAAKLEGDLGLHINSDATAALNVAATGEFLTAVTLEPEDWVRLRIFKTKQLGFEVPLQMSIGAKAVAPIPGEPDELLAAILGLHEAQWLKSPGSADQAAPDLRILKLLQEMQTYAEFLQLDGWVREQLAGLFGKIGSEQDFQALRTQFPTVLALRDAIYQKTRSALEKNFSADLSCRYQRTESSTALIDCSFQLEDEGLRAYQEAVQGRFARLLTEPSARVRFREAVLTDGLSHRTHIELHLPFLSAAEWDTRLNALSKVHIEDGPDGRLLAYTVKAGEQITKKNHYQSTLALAGGLGVGHSHSEAGFSLTYCDTRYGPKGLQPVLRSYGFPEAALNWLATIKSDAEISLILTAPGDLVKGWLEAPGKKDERYFRVFSAVSVAVQQAMRKWLPYVYFSQIDRYRDLAAAQPLVVYQTSRAFSGKGFTYDPQNPQLVCRSAAVALGAELGRVQQMLTQAGHARTAAFYAPSEGPNILARVERDPRLITSLLISDALFVRQLIELGQKGRELSLEVAHDPSKAVRELTRFASTFVNAFHGRLNLLYGGIDFLPFGSLLLVEATHALNIGAGGETPIHAVLRVDTGKFHQTLVNGAGSESFTVPPPSGGCETFSEPQPARSASATPATDLYEKFSRCKLLQKALREESTEIADLLAVLLNSPKA